MSRKKKQPAGDFFLYCKAISNRRYYWSAYNQNRKEVSTGVGTGEFESTIDATYQAIISGLESIKVIAVNRNIQVTTDMQFVINQLQHNDFLCADHLVIKYGKVLSLSKVFLHVRWIWIPKGELTHYISGITYEDITSNKEPVEASIKVNRPRINYYDYIKSEEWRTKANACKRHAGYRCQVCNRGIDEVKLNAHHRTYERLGHENRNDLICLCQDCHELFEKNSNHRPTNNH